MLNAHPAKTMLITIARIPKAAISPTVFRYYDLSRAMFPER